jgi:hypothetical protein
MSDDAEFDAFLKGEGELSRRLQAMPQAEPSAALDAAILNRARLAMAQESHPVAANDAGESTAAPRLAQPFGQRWRVPAGIAATLLAGVFANQAFQSERRQEAALVAEISAPSPVLIAPVPAAPPMMDSAASPAPLPPPQEEERPLAGIVTPPPPVALPEPVIAAKPQLAAQASERAAAPAAAPPAPAPAAAPPALEVSSSPEADAGTPAAASQAPALAARLRNEVAQDRLAEEKKSKSFARAEKTDTISVKGSASKHPDSKAWLAEIERLLKDGDKEKALHEWQRFREAYPREKVAPELEARLDALEK